jgi:DNA-directed RNA polymerase beta subunit
MPSPELPPLTQPQGFPALAPAPVPAPAPAPVPSLPPAQPMRGFGDIAAVRQNIFDQALRSAQSLKPMQNDLYTMQLSDVRYDGPETFHRADQKKAVLTRGSLTRKLRGTWTLTDNKTGEVVSQRPTTIANVPYITDFGTFVNRGVEYTLAHQMRLKPGVFTREKDNGEIEAHVNTLPGKGRSHRYFLDPKTGVFKINIGQAQIPLMPMLKALGVPEQEIRKAWGNEITAVNMEKGDAGTLDKLYARLVNKQVPGADLPAKQKAIADELAKIELDPDVTKRTLGAEYKNMTPETILAVTKKLLAVNRREAESDDRDNMVFQSVVGPEDLISERFSKDRSTLNKLLWKATAKKSLDHVPNSVFDKAISAALIGSGLGSSLEEINPAEIFDHQTRVTRMGEGGIASLDAVPAESRSVQPSHLGFIDYLRTPESGKVGVDMRFARGAMKGADGRVYTPVVDIKTGKTEYKTPQELAETPLVFPGEEKNKLPVVAALVNGRLKYVPKEQAQYALPNMDSTFSALSNMVPMKSMAKGQRVIMASRMFTQALPLVGAQAPLVQSAKFDDAGTSHEDAMGEVLGAPRATDHAQVVAVTPDEITLRDKDGNKKTIDLYNEMPYNRKTFLHQTALVKPGDTVKPGQILARSNFTDDKGTAALGMNMRVAYLPFRGKNYEDAIVISESAAKRLTSEHMYQHEAEWDDNTHTGKKAFVSLFPAEYDKKLLNNFDDMGAIKKGTVVNFGDPLVLVAKKKDAVYGKVHRGRAGSFTNETLTWDHHAPGIVTDVAHTKKGVSVVVKNQAQMDVGDKLTGRFGDKGVISEIVPDDQMPHDKDGNPFEVLVSPLGLISRVNPAQVIEAALGKVAAKTGQPFKVRDFDSDSDLVDFAQKELAKHGLSDTEDLTDPETGRKIAGVLTGNRFFMKLHHTSESKAQGRATGGYTAEGTPAKGGTEGAKRVGMLELGALLSHGAGKVIRDAKMVRGQANPEYWSQFMAGYSAPLPKVPHVYEKFVNQLRGSGVNVVRNGNKTNIMALRDKDIDDLAGDREITNVETVDWKGRLKPIPGGLFDEKLTGGHGGNRWSKITLHEPMPNPIMEDPIRRVLGLTEKEFRGVLAGKVTLYDATGPKAIYSALEKINVPKAIEQAREDIKAGRKVQRDMAVRKLGFLKGAEASGVHPKDWMLAKVPVLPPLFRPVSTMGAKKLPMVADANYLYKELFEANQSLKDASSAVTEYGDERLNVYDSLKAVTGLGEPQHPKNVERNVKGFLKYVFGHSPKYGTMQRKLLSSTVDLVGRAVITPNPDLDMDEVALPEEKAWEIYKPFIVRGLVRRGLPRMQALQAVEEKNKSAFEELNTQMNKRPIVINRAPVLHRYGTMAFHPRLTKNKVMEVNPVITKGFGADFDGDAMQYHVPSTDEAAEEAVAKMLPSKNLFSVSGFKAHYLPNKDYQTGLYVASSRINKKAKPRVYRNKKDAIAAYRRGEIDVDTQVHIVEDDN